MQVEPEPPIYLKDVELPLTSIEAWSTQWAQAIAQITNIQLNPTAQGVEMVLETLNLPLASPIVSVVDNTLIIEIPDAALALPGGSEFRAERPAPGIVAIEATPSTGNGVQIRLIGETSAPTVQVTGRDRSLTFSISSAPSSAEIEEIEVVVTAGRTAQAVQDVPRSITIINRQQIETQTNVTRDMRQILGKLVPGFGPPTNEANPRSIVQSLRGRSAAILIDGVPLTSNYGLDRELRTIDPDIIERIEIVRGPTAIYGGQATGGVINIITRRPTGRSLEVNLDANLGVSLTHPRDSFSNDFGVGVSGTEGIFDYLLSVRREDRGAIFDAQGDRIPDTGGGSLIDSETYSILAKAGFNFDEQQRLQLTFNFYDGRQDTRFISDPSIRQIPGIQKARPLAVNPTIRGTDRAGDRRLVANLNYSHEDILGSRLQAQAYYRDYTSIVGAEDFRGGFFDAIVRQRAGGDKWGGQLQIETPLPFLNDRTNLVWGVDYVRENNKAPFEVFDPVSFDRDNTLRKLEERTFVPLHILNQLGLFAQLQWEISDNFLLNGGVRHERIGVEVEDYTTFFGRPIQGGNLNFNATVFNIGSVYKLDEAVSLFASFSQGFSVPAFGGILRNPPAEFTSVRQNLRLTEAVKVNNYELGIRGQWQGGQATLSGFYNTSDLGEDYAFTGGVSRLVRAPERFYGIEASVDTRLNNSWQVGTTVSWVEGENKEEESGDYLPISTFSIQPLKWTFYVENQTTRRWSNRLQFLFVGGRDRAFKAGVDNAEINPYFVVDYLSNIQIGSGTLQIGIQNLLNSQYFPVHSQVVGGFNETFNAAARGITFTVGYQIRF
ncbi:TonB-dependent receptor [Desertifilum sp. FACHB-1129]|nr:TonB-dependent receptor [Desertifilum sp. FACHB-1129]MBD2323316.1 TonB-dependent receptor [Desertifilum sp. FACHB-866]MBD2333161.1 TonB-dependent receptor [Desertifilum sp. FACHB-868]